MNEALTPQRITRRHGQPSRTEWMQRGQVSAVMAIALLVSVTIGFEALQETGNLLWAAGWWLLAPAAVLWLFFEGLRHIQPGEPVVDDTWIATVQVRFGAPPPPAARPALRRARDAIP